MSISEPEKNYYSITVLDYTWFDVFDFNTDRKICALVLEYLMLPDEGDPSDDASTSVQPEPSLIGNII